ncbi:hypothetical protein W01_16210 [Candidatus Nitrotoga sp. AM1P]|nr:hypothetical protein W01_16210 [Candidatus Nitrotoga sp. AM1P]
MPNIPAADVSLKIANYSFEINPASKSDSKGNKNNPRITTKNIEDQPQIYQAIKARREMTDRSKRRQPQCAEAVIH